MRQMVLIGFLHAEHGSIYAGSWRHPEAATDFTSPAYFQRIARVLEEGKFHMAFFDDRLALPDLYTGNHLEITNNGVRAVKLDPSTILMAMAMATSKLGLGATYSTTYYEPFHVARFFASLDQISGGRAGWNVVTATGGGENFNLDAHLEHGDRYARAQEFVQRLAGDQHEPDRLLTCLDLDHVTVALEQQHCFPVIFLP